MLKRKPPSRPAQTGLDLVEHQQRVMLVRDFPQPLEIAVGRDHDAALTQNRFHQDRNAIRPRVEHRHDRIGVAIGDALEAFNERFETGVDFRIPGGAQGRKRPAMETTVHHHDLGYLRAPLMAEAPRHFDRRFVGLGAGIAEKPLCPDPTDRSESRPALPDARSGKGLTCAAVPPPGDTVLR